MVYEQTITADETARQEVLEIAEEYQISQGKASFIQSLVEENESVSTEDVPQLAVMTMGEISRQIDENEYQLRSEVQVTAVTEDIIRQVKESRQIQNPLKRRNRNYSMGTEHSRRISGQEDAWVNGY